TNKRHQRAAQCRFTIARYALRGKRPTLARPAMLAMWNVKRLRGCTAMPRFCAMALAPSRSQLLGVTRGGLHEFGAGLTTDGVDDCDGVSRLWCSLVSFDVQLFH